MSESPRRRTVERKVVLVRPQRVGSPSLDEQRAAWARRRRTFARLAAAQAFLAVVMFVMRAPWIGAFVAFAAMLSLIVVAKARRILG